MTTAAGTGGRCVRVGVTRRSEQRYLQEVVHTLWEGYKEVCDADSDSSLFFRTSDSVGAS
jgi:hypothetical protein